MSKKNNGGTAFPAHIDQTTSGMSLRDYFADGAMRSIVSRFSISDLNDENLQTLISETAYSIASKMIAEREKENA